jgi:hypothetical protein
MADKVNTLLSLKTRNDPWAEAFEAMGKQNKLLSVDSLIPFDEIISQYPHKKQYNVRTYVQGEHTVRVLQLLDKKDRVIAQWDNLELVDGKLYMRSHYVPRVSWFNWMFSRFYAPRGPTVNVNV